MRVCVLLCSMCTVQMGALANGDYDDVNVPTEVDANEFPSAVKDGAVMVAACGGQHTTMLVI